MLSQKILQTLFRALDLAEEVRAVVSRMRGQATPPPPWDAPPAWPPPGDSDLKEDRARDDSARSYSARKSTPPSPAVRPDPDAEGAYSAKPARKTKSAAKPAAKKKAAAVKKRPAAQSSDAGTTTGGDLAAVAAALDRGEVTPLTESMEVHGRNLLARMVWALAASDKTVGRGLTGPDVAALITKAGIKTVPNNIMRAVRQDNGALFTRAPGEGRAVILTLTDEGRAQARALGLLS